MTEQRYTAEDDATLLRLRAEGLTWNQISDVMVVRTKWSVRVRWARLVNGETMSPAALGIRPKNPVPVTTKRDCITCKRGFKSTGKHHRMCEACRGRAATMAPLLLGIGSSGGQKSGTVGGSPSAYSRQSRMEQATHQRFTESVALTGNGKFS